MSELLIVSTQTLGAAYRLGQEALERGYQLHEVGVQDPGGFCLIEGQSLMLMIREKGVNDLKRVVHVAQAKPEILKAYFGLPANAIKPTENELASLPACIFEAAFIGDLIEYVNTVLSGDPNIVLSELRQIKGSSGYSYAILRGHNLNHLRDSKRVQISYISHPQKTLNNFL